MLLPDEFPQIQSPTNKELKKLITNRLTATVADALYSGSRNPLPIPLLTRQTAQN